MSEENQVIEEQPKRSAPKRKKVEGNIENLEPLREEFRKNKMPERKIVALREKLISVYHEGVITSEEQELMEAILRKERNLSKISSRDEYLLNKIESDRCEESCTVKTDDVPAVLHLRKDLECKFYYDPDFNDGKNRPDSVGRYFVYVPRIVPPEHQLKNATVLKEMRGHFVDAEEYPAEKILIHRLKLKEKEFQAWFEVNEDYLNKDYGQKKETEYTF